MSQKRLKPIRLSLIIAGILTLAFLYWFLSSFKTLFTEPLEFVEVNDPQYLLPEGVDEHQLVKFVKVSDESIFAVVVEPSVNIYIPELAEAETNFRGVLKSDPETKKWEKFLEIQDTSADTSTKNNPYYFWQQRGDFFLTIVDQNGAGSGEGLMKVFRLKDGTDQSWQLHKCFAYTPPSHPEIDIYKYSLYFENFEELDKEDNCEGLVTIKPY